MKIPNIAIIVAGLLALAILLMRNRNQPPLMAPTSIGSGRDTLRITTGQNEIPGQLLVPTGGLGLIGGQTAGVAGKKLLDSKCDCTTTPGQCCWTAQAVVQGAYQSEPQTIGPYCSPNTCDEIKAKFLKDNSAIELNFAMAAQTVEQQRLTIA